MNAKFLEPMKHPTVVLICRVLLGAYFVWASLYKIQMPGEFARVIANYDILPSALISLMAIVLPMLELVAGLCLIFGFYTQGARDLIAAMLAIFMIALTVNIIRGNNFECGCTKVTPGEEPNALLTLISGGPLWMSLLRDVVFVLWLIPAYIGDNRWSIDQLAMKNEQ